MAFAESEFWNRSWRAERPMTSAEMAALTDEFVLYSMQKGYGKVILWCWFAFGLYAGNGVVVVVVAVWPVVSVGEDWRCATCMKWNPHSGGIAAEVASQSVRRVHAGGRLHAGIRGETGVMLTIDSMGASCLWLRCWCTGYHHQWRRTTL